MDLNTPTDSGDHSGVKLIRRSVVKAADRSLRAPYVLPLSNLDYLHPYPVTTIYVYPKPALGDFSSVVATFKSSLAETLDHFFPIAGRIVPNPRTGEPEILCNNEGAEVVEAYAGVSLASLDFYHLDRSVQKLVLSFSVEFPLSVQLTRYACGGFTIFWNHSHMLGDASSFKLFTSSWSEIARTKKISRLPDHNRSILRPRSPPTYNPSIDRTFVKCRTPEEVLNAQEDGGRKHLYYVKASDVDRLRDLASGGGGGRLNRTRIESFSAYVWKILAKAVVGENDAAARCKMGWAVDGRSKMGGTVASNYFGNVVSMAVGEASTRDIEQGSLSDVSGMVSRTLGGVNNEAHFLDLMDWIECHKSGLIWPEIFFGGWGSSLVVSFCHRMAVTELDFGFGPPALGSFYLNVEKSGAGLMNPFPSAAGDGSWVVFAHVWPELAAALESDADRVFQSFTAAHLGLVSPTVLKMVSRY